MFCQVKYVQLIFSYNCYLYLFPDVKCFILSCLSESRSYNSAVEGSYEVKFCIEEQLIFVCLCFQLQFLEKKLESTGHTYQNIGNQNCQENLASNSLYF